MNKIKKENKHLIQVELDNLIATSVFVVEMETILEKLESTSISDFEEKINKKSGFVNTFMSASAFGFEPEYSRLLDLEKVINDKLKISDLTKSKGLKSEVITRVIEKHRTYFTDAELLSKKTLEGLMETFNSLSMNERKEVAFTYSNELKYTPFSNLKSI
tara:strand:- start:828 stop:1307 length:480 start_codon:yes stop_codon:yes gene_type:complete